MLLLNDLLNKMKYGFLVGLTLFFFPVFSWAQQNLGPVYCNSVSDMRPNFGAQTFSQGSNAIAIGQQIGKLDERRVTTLIGCTTNKTWATPIKPIVPSITWTDSQGGVYDVYQSSIPGIGYAIGVADPNAPAFTPVTGTDDIPLYDGPGTTVGFAVRVAFIIIGPLQTGRTTISNDPILNVSSQFNGRPQRNGKVSRTLVSATFDITAKTCSLTSPASQEIRLNTVPARLFNNLAVGSPLESTVSSPITISANCQSGVALFATINDSNNTGSRENYLTNASVGAGSAEGVGVQLLRDGSTIVLMGPESSDSANVNSFAIGARATADNAPRSFTLAARYIKTGSEVKAGIVQSLGTVTFSYR